MRFDFKTFAIAAAFLGALGFAPSVASASTVSTFGALPQATFGGQGIPNDRVAITTIEDGENEITLGLTATPRFNNPRPTDDGAGTFTAQPGANQPPGASSPGTKWNFSFFAEITGTAGSTLANYGFRLLYDFDPGLTTPDADLGVLDLNQSLADINPLLLGLSTVQGSQNLAFPFLGVDSPTGSITAPAFGPFNPDSAGEYSFALSAFSSTGQELGRSSMTVNVVPVPAALPLFLTALGGLLFWRRQRKPA